MLHYHSVSAVDELLIGNKRAYRRRAVKAVFDRDPVEIRDGVESAIGATATDHAIARRLFKYHLAVLAPEFDDIGGFRFIVAVKLVASHIARLIGIFLVGDNFAHLILGSTC